LSTPRGQKPEPALPADQTCRIRSGDGEATVARICVEKVPDLREQADRPGHRHACHLRRG
jgi:hypothetical protein